jgi:hypothetical protein
VRPTMMRCGLADDDDEFAGVQRRRVQVADREVDCAWGGAFCPLVGLRAATGTGRALSLDAGPFPS